MPETLGLPTGMGQAGDRDKFNIQPIRGFDYYFAHHWFLPNSHKASLNIPLEIMVVNNVP